METTVIWQEFLTVVRHEIGSRVVETWFKTVKLVSWDAHKKIVSLQTPNTFVKDWLINHYLDLFRHHLGRLLNERDIAVIFTDLVQEVTVPMLAPKENGHEPRYEPARRQSTTVTRVPHAGRISTYINHHYLFENQAHRLVHRPI